MRTMINGYDAVVSLTRGGIVESIHFGAFTVVDPEGNLLVSGRDPNLVTFPRSSMKPFQVLPFIEAGGQEHFGLTDEELAIMCASHTGTDEHVRVIKSIHEKVGLCEDNLQCGFHWPSDKETSFEMRKRGETPTPYRHNCSGKHSGMLAMAKMQGEPLDSYLDIKHPVQKRILQKVAEFCEVLPESLIVGTDGCSAPVFAMPLKVFAHATAKLANPENLSESQAKACLTATKVMRAYPTMVAGPGQLDTVLMEVMAGKVFSKGGAEGYQMIGVLPGVLEKYPKGLGITMKFSDGDAGRRATSALTVAILSALGFEKEMQSEAFAKFNAPVLHNSRGLEIGEIKVNQTINL
ncbi:MAG TPA: asparaginase [Anaerolineaceae bacterium]|nr:asparaginase [Anaerolineaceae bacterium]